MSKHLDALDAGDPDARDDLALVLRILVCPGDGDKLIARTVSRFRVPEPTVRAGGQPTDRKTAYLYLGSVPAEPRDDKPIPSSERDLPFTQWASRTVIITGRSIPRVVRWNELISAYGNTYGAHASGTVPDLLSHVSLLGVGSTDLGTYLLRQAGRAAEDGVASLLHALDRRPDSRVSRPWQVLSTWPTALKIDVDGKRIAGFGFDLGFAETISPQVVLEMETEDVRAQIHMGENRQFYVELVGEMAPASLPSEGEEGAGTWPHD